VSLQQAREDVVQAGKQLVKAGLIARTWGNVSARISESQFVITPSGRAYETLPPAEIVTVNLAYSGSQGEISPSSEEGFSCCVLPPAAGDQFYYSSSPGLRFRREHPASQYYRDRARHSCGNRQQGSLCILRVARFPKIAKGSGRGPFPVGWQGFSDGQPWGAVPWARPCRSF